MENCHGLERKRQTGRERKREREREGGKDERGETRSQLQEQKAMTLINTI